MSTLWPSHIQLIATSPVLNITVFYDSTEIHYDYVNNPTWFRNVRRYTMAHEGLAAFMIILGVLLLLAYYLGPRNEARLRKRKEGQMMLIPSAVILFFLAVVVFSGVLG